MWLANVTAKTGLCQVVSIISFGENSRKKITIFENNIIVTIYHMNWMSVKDTIGSIPVKMHLDTLPLRVFPDNLWQKNNNFA